MKFVTNKRGSIYELKDNGLKINIHSIVGCGDELYLSAYRLDLRDVPLNTSDFDEAVELSKEIVRKNAAYIYREAMNYVDAKNIEISKW